MNSTAMDIPQCQSTPFMQRMWRQMIKKTSAGHQETTYSGATFIVELRTCFQTENGKAKQLHMQGKHIHMTS